MPSPRGPESPRMMSIPTPGFSTDVLCGAQARPKPASSNCGIQTLVPPCSCQAIRLGELRNMEARAAEFYERVCSLSAEIDTIKSQPSSSGENGDGQKRQAPRAQCTTSQQAYAAQPLTEKNNASNLHDWVKKEALPLSLESARNRELRTVQARAAEYYDKFCSLSLSIEEMRSRHSTMSEAPCPSCAQELTQSPTTEASDIFAHAQRCNAFKQTNNDTQNHHLMMREPEVDKLYLQGESLSRCGPPEDIMFLVHYNSNKLEISQSRVVIPETACCTTEL